VIRTTIFPGRYVQGASAIERLGDETARLGSKAFLCCSPFVVENLLPKFRADVESKVEIAVARFNRECTEAEIDRLTELARAAEAEVVVGIGGGKLLDTAKAVAYYLDVPVVIVPTIASTDAPCSALSVIYTPEGVVKSGLVFPRNPDLVLVDTTIIAQAPVRLLVAGMGDALSTWFEADTCQRTYSGNMTGDVGSFTAFALARLCYDTLLEYGVAALTACQKGVVTQALERIVEANTLLSGVGFESGGLATAHALHDGFTRQKRTHGHWHGEKVAFGVLVSLFLTDKPPRIVDEVYGFCESVGLPTTLAAVGLEDPTEEELRQVAEASCAVRSIHHEPIPVTPESVYAALVAADAEGQRRQAAR
jgi:glycerol dehydrogenase